VQSKEQQVDLTRLAVTMTGYAVPSSSERDFWIIQRRLLGHVECCYHWVVDDAIKSLEIGENRDEDRSGADGSIEEVLNAVKILDLHYRDQG
jgi:hypothetical protein